MRFERIAPSREEIAEERVATAVAAADLVANDTVRHVVGQIKHVPGVNLLTLDVIMGAAQEQYATNSD